MPIRPETLVRGADGRPQPPQELIERLKKYDARVGLYYTKCSWAITEAWAENDPRRARILEGDMSEDMAFDICGYLPLTCSLDEAPAYIERELRSYSAEQFAALRYSISHWNDAIAEKSGEDEFVAGTIENLDTSKIKPIESQVFVPESAPVPDKPKGKKSK